MKVLESGRSLRAKREMFDAEVVEAAPRLVEKQLR